MKDGQKAQLSPFIFVYLSEYQQKDYLEKHSPILITGATGLVGSYVLRLLLREGYTALSALRRSTSRMDLVEEIADQVQWREGDLMDYYSLEDALAGIEVVIHCAALVSFQPKARQTLLRINRDGTANLVNAALYQKVDRLIHVSSVAALGRSVQNEPIHEDSKWEYTPEVAAYSISKFQAELEVWRGQAEGLSVACVYPSVILGGGFWEEGSAQIFAYASRGPSFYSTGATGVVDVRDVARGVQLVLERNEDGDRFLLNGANVTLQDLLTGIAKQMNLSPPRRAFPFWAANLLALAESIRCRITGGTPVLTRETVAASYRSHHYSNERSRQELGLSYRSLEITISETAALFLETQEKGSGVLPF